MVGVVVVLAEVGYLMLVTVVEVSWSCWTVDSRVSTELREDWLPLRHTGHG